MTYPTDTYSEHAQTAQISTANRAYALPTSTASALLLFALGAFFTYFGSEYRIGTLRSMGPGMLPVVGGLLLISISVLVALTGKQIDERLGNLPYKQLAAILGSVVAFSLLLEPIGLALSAPLLIAGALVASGQGSLKTGLALGIPLTIASIVAFPLLLGVPLKVLP